MKLLSSFFFGFLLTTSVFGVKKGPDSFPITPYHSYTDRLLMSSNDQLNWALPLIEQQSVMLLSAVSTAAIQWHTDKTVAHAKALRQMLGVCIAWYRQLAKTKDLSKFVQDNIQILHFFGFQPDRKEYSPMELLCKYYCVLTQLQSVGRTIQRDRIQLKLEKKQVLLEQRYKTRFGKELFAMFIAASVVALVGFQVAIFYSSLQ